MPIYEYQCQECGLKFEALRSLNDADTPIECSRCMSTSTKRVISVFFAQSNGKQIAGNSASNCSGCSSKSCSSCGH